MDFERPWNPGDISKTEGELLNTYHDQRGGLLLTEVNVAFPVPGSRQRRIDGMLFPDPPESLTGKAYRYTPSTQENLKELVGNYAMELIEIHKWGFYGFGQIVGKAEIVETEWNPLQIQKVFIPCGNSSESFNPNESSDPATEAVFDNFDIKVVTVQ